MRAPRDLAIMVTCFNLSLIWIKKSASEYICIISTLKRIFGKQIQVFHKLADTADEFTQLFSFYLFLHICICMYIFLYIYIVVYMCISCVKITFLCVYIAVYLFIGDMDTAFPNQFKSKKENYWETYISEILFILLVQLHYFFLNAQAS